MRTFILDEADEMLRMGFIDDVEWVLEKLPEKRQMALFSATMPRQIARIAERYLNDPQIVKIEVKTRAADTIRQRFWPVTGRNKLDALTRILEAEEIDAMLIFVRTKTSTVEISEKLEARGYASAPLNGDIQQKQRERTVDQLKKGKLDIIVATDVAARGLDVARVSHVLNYDIPSDTEAYIHRIGRTGRAGRSGEAILFVAPREKRMKQTIERATGKSIDQMEMPSTDEINKQRIEKFKQRIHQTIENENLSFYESLVAGYTTIIQTTHRHKWPQRWHTCYREMYRFCSRSAANDQTVITQIVSHTKDLIAQSAVAISMIKSVSATQLKNGTATTRLTVTLLTVKQNTAPLCRTRNKSTTNQKFQWSAFA